MPLTCTAMLWLTKWRLCWTKTASLGMRSLKLVRLSPSHMDTLSPFQLHPPSHSPLQLHPPSHSPFHCTHHHTAHSIVPTITQPTPLHPPSHNPFQLHPPSHSPFQLHPPSHSPFHAHMLSAQHIPFACSQLSISLFCTPQNPSQFDCVLVYDNPSKFAYLFVYTFIITYPTCMHTLSSHTSQFAHTLFQHCPPPLHACSDNNGWFYVALFSNLNCSCIRGVTGTRICICQCH